MAVMTGTNGNVPSFSRSNLISRSDKYVYAHWKAVDRLRQAANDVLDVVRKVQIVKPFKVNATGRKISGVLSFSGYKMTASLCTKQSRGSGQRTDDSIVTEIMLTLMRKVFFDLQRSKAGYASVNVGTHPFSTFLAFEREIRELKRTGCQDTSPYNVDVAEAILSSELIRDPGELVRVIQGFRAVNESGDSMTRFSSHEAGKALRDFKKCAAYALLNGMDVDVLDRALKEALVEATIRS